MVDFEGQILQILNEGVTLKELLHPNFVNKLDEEFKDATVTPINITLALEKEDDIPTSITLVHRHKDDTKHKKFIIDVDDPSDLKGIFNSVNVVK